MNKFGLIGHRKKKENAGQKRKQPLDSNKTKKKARKTDDEEESNFSDRDEVEDSEDVVDHLKVKAVKVIGINCPECSILVENKHNLNEHLLNVHHQSPFICGAFGCKQRFDKSKLLQKHYQLHDNKTKWICTATNCKYTTLCQRYLLVHFHSCHMKGRYQCGMCFKEYPFRKQAQWHFDYHHKTKTFKCSLGGCHFKSSFEIKLKEHQLSHLNLKPYECTWEDCGHAASRRRDVITHVRMVHFKLPHSLKETKQRQIKCDRDPNEFVRSKSFDLNASLRRELQKANRND